MKENKTKWRLILSECIFLLITISVFLIFMNLSIKWIIRYLILILYISTGFITLNFLKTLLLLSPLLIPMNIRWFIKFENYYFPFSFLDILGLIYIPFLFSKFKNLQKKDEFKTPFLILLIAILFSSLNSLKPHFTFFISTFFILGYSYYRLMIEKIESEKELEIFIYLLFFCFILNSIVAIFQHRGGFFIFGEEVSPLYEKGTLFPGGRVKGLFIHANSFAAILAIFSPFALSFFLSKEIDKKYRIYSLFTFLLMTLSIFLTRSRNGYITYLISCITFLFLILLKQKGKKFHFVMNMLFFIGVINFLVLMKFPFIYKRILSIFLYQYDPSARIRFFIWQKSISTFIEQFLTGIGWGNFAFQPYSFKLLIPHNLYINILLELGIIGGIAFIYFVYALFRKLFNLFSLSDSKNLHFTLPLLSAWIGFFLNNILDSIFTSPTHTIENKFFWILLAFTTLGIHFFIKNFNSKDFCKSHT